MSRKRKSKPSGSVVTTTTTKVSENKARSKKNKRVPRKKLLVKKKTVVRAKPKNDKKKIVKLEKRKTNESHLAFLVKSFMFPNEHACPLPRACPWETSLYRGTQTFTVSSNSQGYFNFIVYPWCRYGYTIGTVASGGTSTTFGTMTTWEWSTAMNADNKAVRLVSASILLTPITNVTVRQGKVFACPRTRLDDTTGINNVHEYMNNNSAMTYGPEESIYAFYKPLDIEDEHFQAGNGTTPLSWWAFSMAGAAASTDLYTVEVNCIYEVIPKARSKFISQKTINRNMSADEMDAVSSVMQELPATYGFDPKLDVFSGVMSNLKEKGSRFFSMLSAGAIPTVFMLYQWAYNRQQDRLARNQQPVGRNEIL